MFYCGDVMKWQHWGSFLAALICMQVDNSVSHSHLTITSQPSEPTVGQTVLLNIKYEEQIRNIKWYKGNGRNSSMNILTYNPLRYGPMFTRRENVMDNGSLQISNLMTSDSGIYTLEATFTKSMIVKNIRLTVKSATVRTPLPVSTTSSLSHLPSSDGASRVQNHYGVIGIVIGSLAAAIVSVVVAVFLYRRLNRSSQAPVSGTEKPTTRSSPNISSKQQINEGRRLPSIPRNTPIYQNVQDRNNDEEHPYTDLTYIYMSSSYHNLQGPQQSHTTLNR